MKLSAALCACFLGAMTLVVPSSAHAGNLVLNGSFEDLNNNFVNTNGNYMALFANATSIADWTVSSSTINEIVWGRTLTSDNQSASDGSFFVDVTGFGGDSPNGAIEQTLQNMVVNQQYTLSLDVVYDVGLPLVTVGGNGIALTAGVPFLVGSTTWTPESGTFTAPSSSALLQISNQIVPDQIEFIDNVSVVGPSAPEPSSFVLAGIAGLVLRRVAKRRSRE